MRRRHLLSTSLVAAVLTTSARAAFIYTNTSNLLPNTPNQVIKIYVSGNDIIQGENLDFQINTGASGPFFTGVDIITGTIFAASNTGQTTPNDPAYNVQGILTSGTAAGHLAVDLTTTISPAVTTDNGLLATLLITTTATTGTQFSLTMLNTLNRSSNFGTGGNNTIGFSTPHTLLSIGNTPDRQWKTNGGGAWDSDLNWTPFAPYAQGDIANFLGALTSSGSTAVVTLDGVRTVGTLNFNNAAASYDLQPGAGGSLLMDNGTAPQAPVIAVLAGGHVIEAPIALAASTNVSVAPGSTLTLSKAISGSGAALSLSGGGKLLLTSAINSYGATNIAAGAWMQIGSGGIPGSFGSGAIANAGTLTVSNLAQPLASPLTGSGTVIVDGLFGLNTTSTAATWLVTSTGNLQVGNGGTSGLLVGVTITSSGMIGFNRIDAAVDTIALTGNGTLTQSGSGTTTLASPVNYSGPTIISAGKLVFGGGVAHAIAGVSGAGSLQIDSTLTSDGVVLASSGVLTVNGTQTLRSSASGGAYTTFALGNSSAALSGSSKVSSLVFGASGILDIRNNALIIEATAGTKASLIQLIASDVTSAHITSSTAATNPSYGVIVADNADLGATTFGGLALDANSIIVTQALLEDANLDGVVNPTDLLIWAHNFNNSGSYSVASGDLNNDGVVNPTDLLIWAHNFNNAIGGGAPSGGGGGLGDGGGLSGVGAVPEPASLLLLGVGAMGLLSRRRRREAGARIS